MSSDRGGGDLGTIIIAGAIGAAVGAVVALMMAPKTGEEFRAELGEKAKDYAEVAKEKASVVAEKAKEKAAEVAERAKEKAGQIRADLAVVESETEASDEAEPV